VAQGFHHEFPVCPNDLRQSHSSILSGVKNENSFVMCYTGLNAVSGRPGLPLRHAFDQVFVADTLVFRLCEDLWNPAHTGGPQPYFS
jgi:hypothetical protein